MRAATLAVMESFPSPYQLVLLSTRFRAPERRLFFPNARLYFDRIELTGWHLHERFEDVIHLPEVARIDWHPSESDNDELEANVVFEFSDGSALPLMLDQLPSWQHTLENRVSWRRVRAAA